MKMLNEQCISNGAPLLHNIKKGDKVRQDKFDVVQMKKQAQQSQKTKYHIATFT
jgi:hypothetical protein